MSGMPKSSCSAMAEPMTSARSQAAMAISAKSQRSDGGAAAVGVAAGLGEVALGGDAEFEREALEEDRHQVGEHDDEEQGVAVARAAGEVGGPVAGVHVADGDEEAGAGEAEDAAPEGAGVGEAHGAKSVGKGRLGWCKRWLCRTVRALSLESLRTSAPYVLDAVCHKDLAMVNTVWLP